MNLKKRSVKIVIEINSDSWACAAARLRSLADNIADFLPTPSGVMQAHQAGRNNDHFMIMRWFPEEQPPMLTAASSWQWFGVKLQNDEPL